MELPPAQSASRHRDDDDDDESVGHEDQGREGADSTNTVEEEETAKISISAKSSDNHANLLTKHAPIVLDNKDLNTHQQGPVTHQEEGRLLSSRESSQSSSTSSSSGNFVASPMQPPPLSLPSSSPVDPFEKFAAVTQSSDKPTQNQRQPHDSQHQEPHEPQLQPRRASKSKRLTPSKPMRVPTVNGHNHATSQPSIASITAKNPLMIGEHARATPSTSSSTVTNTTASTETIASTASSRLPSSAKATSHQRDSPLPHARNATSTNRTGAPRKPRGQTSPNKPPQPRKGPRNSSKKEDVTPTAVTPKKPRKDTKKQLPPVAKTAGHASSQRIDPSRHGVKRNVIKHIWVVVNRNPHFQKAQAHLDKREFHHLDKFLDYLTEVVKTTRLGLVRSLHCAATGTQVEKLSDIKDGGLYVVCGRKPFKPKSFAMDSLPHSEQNQLVGKNSAQSPVNHGSTATLPSVTQQQSMAAKGSSQKHAASSPRTKKAAARKSSTSASSPSGKLPLPTFGADKKKSIVSMFVYNGVNNGECTRVLLSQSDRKTIDHLLQRISDKMASSLKYSSAKKIYTLDGAEITKPSEIKDVRDGGAYIVVDRPPFQKPYIRLIDGKLVPIPRTPTKFPKIKREYVTGKRRKTRGKKEIAYQLILEELITEELVSFAEAQCAMFEKIKDAAEKHSEKLRQTVLLDRSHDSLVPNILNYVMQRERTETWQLENGEDTEAQIMAAYRSARSGLLQHWERAPHSLVALILLLDQIPRQFFASDDGAEMFATDELALNVLTRSQTSGVFDGLLPSQKLFACFVLSRQETLYYQEVCLQFWDAIQPELPPAYNAFGAMFEQGKEVIERFGRFPERNAVLGRESTAEELVYLDETIAGQGGFTLHKSKRLMSKRRKSKGSRGRTSPEKSPEKKRPSRMKTMKSLISFGGNKPKLSSS